MLSKSRINKLEKEIREIRLNVSFVTCSTCQSNDVCEYAFDAYNTNGDCLAIK